MGKDKSVKSLKTCITTASINKEVDKWRADECFGYLDKHSKEKKFSSILKKKLMIVFKKYCKKFEEVTGNDYKEKLEEILGLAKKFFDKDEINKSILENKELFSLIMGNNNLKKNIDSKNALKSIVTDKKYNNYLLNNINLLKAALQDESTMKQLISNTDLFLKILNSADAQNLVKENINCLKEMVKFNDLRSYITSSDMFDHILTTYHKVLDEDIEFRKNLLRDVNYKKNTKFAGGYLDYDNHGDLPHQWAGADICLWAKGYTVKRFINSGTYGAFFSCIDPKSNKEIGLKVTNLETGGTIGEFNLLAELNDQLKEKDTDDDTTKKIKKRARKYTVVPHKIDDSNNILEAPLAKGNLKVSKNNGTYRTFDSVIKNARQALKSVLYLHGLGYSHNDIKFQNFLTIDKSKIPDDTSGEEFKLTKEQRKNLKLKLNDVKDDLKSLKNLVLGYISQESLDKIMSNIDKKIKVSKIGENDAKLFQEEQFARLRRYIQNNIVSNRRVVVTDFGSLTKIPKEGEKGIFASIASAGYLPECEMDSRGNFVEREQIVKRDVYALGVTFYQLLVQQGNTIDYWRSIKGDNLSDVRELRQHCDKYKYNYLFNNVYANQKFERIAKFVFLINKMIKINYKERITIEEAYKEIKKL